MGNSSKVNLLNDLTPPEWLKFTKTWFVHYPGKRKEGEINHPAKFPEKLAEEFIRFFTKEGQVVFDPFLGTGSTLVAAQRSGRKGIGIELQQKYVDFAREKVMVETGDHKSQIIIQGDAARTDEYWKERSLPVVDLVFTSPPYGYMLNKEGELSRRRRKEGLDVAYSIDKRDLGNSESYDEFMRKLLDIFLKIKPKIKAKGHLIIIMQNYMHKGEYKMLAWDIGRELAKHFQFRGEKIWCQNHKTLLPYGYRYCFVPNVHHHYCLIFRKMD